MLSKLERSHCLKRADRLLHLIQKTSSHGVVENFAADSLDKLSELPLRKAIARLAEIGNLIIDDQLCHRSYTFGSCSSHEVEKLRCYGAFLDSAHRCHHMVRPSVDESIQ